MKRKNIPFIPFRHQAWLHLLYWLLVWVFLSLFFGFAERPALSAIAYSLFILMITAGVSYWVGNFLIPRFLLRKRYLLFVIYLIFTIIVSVDLELITTMLFLIFVEKFQLWLIDYHARDVFSLLAGTYFIVFLSAGIRLAQFWFREQQQRQTALTEKVENELKMLRSQVHPHFLFNTLNNIYSLTLQQSEKAPEAVLRLSSMLDYLLYQGNNEWIGLDKECEMIEEYIALERLRFGDRLRVDFQKEGDPSIFRIAPILLLPLVENAFKHGLSRIREKVWLKIMLHVSERKIKFLIENPLPPIRKMSDKGGIGLENLRRRLELLFPGLYELETSINEQVFRVELSLQKQKTGK